MHRLRNKYRMVIMNESTFEEKASLTLTKLNVFIVMSSLLVFFAGLMIVLVRFTPLKEYLPGRVDKDQTRIALELSYKLDSLENQLVLRDQMMLNGLNILSGRVDQDTAGQSVPDTATHHEDLNPSPEELTLRDQVKPKQDYSLRGNSKNKANALFAPFYTPLSGLVSARFDPLIEHLATDVVSKTDPTVKATLDGTVILATWTAETGHVIALQHANNLISIYKHNAVLLKKVGNFVDAGEAIAMVGNSGELSTGPHLHFELWHNGIAVNPEDYMVFK